MNLFINILNIVIAIGSGIMLLVLYLVLLYCCTILNNQLLIKILYGVAFTFILYATYYYAMLIIDLIKGEL